MIENHPFESKSHLEETLCRLYLRLNGYFVNNFLIHSESQGNLASELDIIAVRFPNHSQRDRKVDSSTFLELDPVRTEILMADVKRGKKLEFNKGLRLQKSSIVKLFKWVGFFSDAELDKHIDEIFFNFNDIHRTKKNEFRSIDCDLKSGLFRIKLTFFAVGLPPSVAKDLRYINGQEVLDYCWLCLRTSDAVETCSRTYDYDAWGDFKYIVRYFKKQRIDSSGSLSDAYEYFHL